MTDSTMVDNHYVANERSFILKVLTNRVGKAVNPGNTPTKPESDAEDTQMKIKRITEIGVAVKDLDRATQLMVDLLGAEAGEAITMEMYQMRYRMCRVGKVDFELMEPIEGLGMIADFIAKRGEGIHHVAFAVEDIENGMRVLIDKGVRFLSDQPIPISSHGQDLAGNDLSGQGKVNFTLPKSILGILFEFIEYPEGYAFD